ncbi:MAG: hypothetical protein R3C68_14255 [Myxococcota bacterium]
MLCRNFDRALRGFDDALVLYKGLRDQRGKARTLMNRGQVQVWLGDFAKARVHLSEAQYLTTQLGDELTQGEAEIHLGLALALGVNGDMPEGRRCLKQRAATYSASVST